MSNHFFIKTKFSINSNTTNRLSAHINYSTPNTPDILKIKQTNFFQSKIKNYQQFSKSLPVSIDSSDSVAVTPQFSQQWGIRLLEGFEGQKIDRSQTPINRMRTMVADEKHHFHEKSHMCDSHIRMCFKSEI